MSFIVKVACLFAVRRPQTHIVVFVFVRTRRTSIVPTPGDWARLRRMTAWRRRHRHERNKDVNQTTWKRSTCKGLSKHGKERSKAQTNKSVSSSGSATMSPSSPSLPTSSPAWRPVVPRDLLGSKCTEDEVLADAERHPFGSLTNLPPTSRRTVMKTKMNWPWRRNAQTHHKCSSVIIHKNEACCCDGPMSFVRAEGTNLWLCLAIVFFFLCDVLKNSNRVKKLKKSISQCD